MRNSNLAKCVNNVVLSSTEKVIGTWINNKPLYGRYITTQGITGNVSISHNIANVDDIHINYGRSFMKITNAKTTIPLVFERWNQASDAQSVGITQNNILVDAKTGWTAYTMYIYVEYTKTTD